ncbi:hypothetical protein GOBAR_AA06672 [Gossypium barbadense]|uniref:Uncharacterized protein n=1 Tax=Gossypium barbadense TaxID=3634 RepID=A0A2P5YEF8_GOSBA|nr:hypothetical protein GOBAR_AA06672 [Gossypium barbadense]
MGSVNSSHHHDHATERFSNPHGWAHGRALGHAHTTGGDTTVRYGRVKIGKNFLNTGCDKLPRSYDMVVGESVKPTREGDTPVSINRG